MAKAHVVKQVVREPKSRRRVVLVLTEGEADFLINQCYRVRGDRRLSPVKYAVRIRSALQRAVGYKWVDCDARVLSGGAVRFATYDQLTHRKIAKLKAEAQEALSDLSWEENITSTQNITTPFSVTSHLPEEPSAQTFHLTTEERKAQTLVSAAGQAASLFLGALRDRLS